MSAVTPAATPTLTPPRRPAAYSSAPDGPSSELEPATETFLVYAAQWRRLMTTLGTTLLKSARPGS